VFFDRLTRTFLAAHILNALPVKRGRGMVRGLAAMRERLLRKPTVFVLFPAEKRSRDGSFVSFRDVSDNREGWDAIRVTLERSVRALGSEPALDEHAPQPSAQ
jgi:hypothetical protein